MKENRINLSTRAFVRIISYAAALIATFATMSILHMTRADSREAQLQYSYMRAVEDLSLSLDNIKTTLNKGLYAATPEMMTKLSGKLWSEAANAKAALAQLPVEELNLETTYKFLSQVGNYSQSLSEKMSGGAQLDGNEQQNLQTLYSFAEGISGKMWTIEKQVQQGDLSFEQTVGNIDYSGGEATPAYVTEGFTDFEEGFSDYPTLIYDGPFSDHILERSPLMLEGQADVGQEKALEKALRVSGEQVLSPTGEEAGKMPSYVFENGDTTVSVTKGGGYFCYMMKYRQLGDATIGSEKAIEIAEDYLESLGIDDITETYYEIKDSVCIVNFAGEENDVVLYTDLVKIGIALDNGEVVSFDARGYLTNHTDRNLAAPAITEQEAASKLSANLNLKDIRLCVIPSSGLNERYCYELQCTDRNGRHVLVYINADTGEEEDILLLQISGSGRLTV